jgi:hypothetical protein
MIEDGRDAPGWRGESVEHWRQRLPRDGRAPAAQFVSVERSLPGDVVARLSDQSNFIHVGDQGSDDMGELASVLSVCDHTISIDNSTAHLAGALGRPMSLMLTDGAAGGEWRWHCVGRDHSPWYPSARIFRRTEHGD